MGKEEEVAWEVRGVNGWARESIGDISVGERGEEAGELDRSSGEVNLNKSSLVIYQSICML